MAADKANLAYAISNACVPIIADHVTFTDLVSDGKLERVSYFDILYGAQTYYRPRAADNVSIPPDEKWCTIEIRDEKNFESLNQTVAAALSNDKVRNWRRVVAIGSDYSSYKASYCDGSGLLLVQVEGFRAGDKWGDIPIQNGTSVPNINQATALDVIVRQMHSPDVCEPTPS